MRLRYEREVGQLDFNDFVASSNLTNGVGVTAGNPEPQPAAGLGQRGRRRAAALEGREPGAHRRATPKITDVVDRGPVFASDGTVFDRPTNIGAGTKDELILDLTLPFDALGWKGALLKGDCTQRWSAVTDPTTGQKREISGLHPIDWNVNFSQDLPRQNLNLGVDLYGGFRQALLPLQPDRDRQAADLRAALRRVEAEARTGACAWSCRSSTAPKVRLRDTLQIFPGPRSAGGRPDIQDRQFHFPHGFYFRLLKNFG